MHVRTYALFLFLMASWMSAVAQHIEIGGFGSYGKFDVPPFPGSAVGLGLRLDLGLGSHLALEGEGSYDFKHPSVQVLTTGAASVAVSTLRLGIIHGNGGLKVQTKGGSYFLFVKGGALNFRPEVQVTAVTGTVVVSGPSAQSDFTKGVLYPGGGIGFHAGILGIRIDAGDEIYWQNGAQHNLRVTFGPTIRF